MPFVRVNSQFEPLSVLLTVALYWTRTVITPPAGRIPPRGTTIVWSLMLAGTAAPSTVTGPSRIEPRRAAMVFRLSRSIGSPEVL